VISTVEVSSKRDPAFCFMLVVWGERYRRYFSDYCLPSLLAPNNIPCIANKRGSRFAIATTAEDWAELNKLEVFRLLKTHIEPVLVQLPSFSHTAVMSSGHEKMLVMSSGHKKLSNYAFANDSFGININPDSIYSDYTVHTLQQSARRGVKMVLYPGVRFEFEGVLAELKARGFMSDPTSIAVPPRVAAGIGVRNPHPFTIACNWDNDCFFEYPVYHCLTGPSNSVMIVHTISMGPIMLDYGAISDHRDEIFEKWTLDGDYAHSNFGHFDLFNEIEYVDDSDTFTVLGFTPKGEEAAPKVPVRGGRLLKNFHKGLQLWRVYSDPVADPLKRRLYLRQVVIHESDLGEEWKQLANRDRRILEKYVVAAIADKDILAYDEKYRPEKSGAAWLRSSNARSQRTVARIAFALNFALIRSARWLAHVYYRLDFYRRHYSAQGPAHVRYYYYRTSFYVRHFSIQGPAHVRYYYYRVQFFVRRYFVRLVAIRNQALAFARAMMPEKTKIARISRRVRIVMQRMGVSSSDVTRARFNLWGKTTPHGVASQSERSTTEMANGEQSS
jgi:hypothetical protein